MKHLRKFNEENVPLLLSHSLEELSLKREELQDFCETHLAYLLDEGFELKVYGGYTSFQVTLQKTDKSIFLWHDIIDHFLPFLKFLKDNYNLEKVDPSSNVPYHRKADIKFVDYRWHGIMYQTKGLLEERHNALDTKKLREVYFMVTIK